MGIGRIFELKTADHGERRIEILIELQTRGIAVPTQPILDGRFAIRICITNHRSELADFDALVCAVISLSEAIVGSKNLKPVLAKPAQTGCLNRGKSWV
jgi:hypothetical protein